LTLSGFRHLHLPSVDSTNAEAYRLAKKGEGGPLWITADEQTAGRGRRGRDWVSKSGNLFATFLTTLAVNPATATQVSFVTALALYDACSALLSVPAGLALKWPNDLLLAEKKLAGILLETLPQNQPEKIALAIGCGVNLQHGPDQSAYPATWLNAHLATPVTPDRFLAKLADALTIRLSQWKNGAGFDLIAKAWQERASHIGKSITLIAATETFTGTFSGLADDGALILDLPDGKQKLFHAGDVSLRPQNHQAES